MITLMRRELWEHRGLWIAPLVTAALIVLATVLGSSQSGAMTISMQGHDFLQSLTADRQTKFFMVFVAAMMVPQLVVALVVVFFYLLDSLYSERKDRSILFWKSMPVSDAATVGSKALVALVLVPLWVWLLSLLVSALAFAGIAMKLSGTPYALLGTWHTGAWLAVQGLLLSNLLVAALWYAPIAAALLFLSAFARRAVFLWAMVPPVLVMFVEQVAFGTERFADFLQYRFIGFFNSLGFLTNRPKLEGADAQIGMITTMAGKLSALPQLANVDLWLGLAAAAALGYGAIRLRRYRDDT